MNNMKKKEEEAPAEPEAPPRQEVLLEEIRNLLAKQS
jgi:large conductance mechanosensitive channel